jgi:hypothetical protein
MQGKYDRNVEDIERARMEEGRYWGARQAEPGSFPFASAIPSHGQIDPTWLFQQQRLQQPFQQFWNPYVQPSFQYGLNPGLLQSYYNPVHQQFLQHPGFQQNIPYGYQNIQSQLGFQQPGINPYGFPTSQSMLYSQPYSGQQLPFQQLPTQFPSIAYSQMEGSWSEFPERQSYFPRAMMGRPISRIFHRPPRNYRRSDELIRDEICKKLAMTPEIDATDVDVIVKDGEVTLRGTVDDRFEKRLVEDIIENTFGVRDLLNEVRVGTRQPEQEFIGTTKGKEK